MTTQTPLVATPALGRALKRLTIEKLLPPALISISRLLREEMSPPLGATARGGDESPPAPTGALRALRGFAVTTAPPPKLTRPIFCAINAFTRPLTVSAPPLGVRGVYMSRTAPVTWRLLYTMYAMEPIKRTINVPSAPFKAGTLSTGPFREDAEPVVKARYGKSIRRPSNRPRPTICPGMMDGAAPRGRVDVDVKCHVA